MLVADGRGPQGRRDRTGCPGAPATTGWCTSRCPTGAEPARAPATWSTVAVTYGAPAPPRRRHRPPGRRLRRAPHPRGRRLGGPAGLSPTGASRSHPRHAVSRTAGARALDAARLRLTPMLAAAAIVPAPPAFVPELMGRAAHELDDIRTAADTALTALAGELQAAEDVTGTRGQIVVVAPGEAEAGKPEVGRPEVGEPRRLEELAGRAATASTARPDRSGSASSAWRSTSPPCPARRTRRPGPCRRPCWSGATSPAGSPGSRTRRTGCGPGPAG